MKKLNIQFKVSHQSIWRTDNVRLISKSKNYVKAVFEFTDDWDGITKTAIFKKGTSVYHVLLQNDSCDVPWEVLASDGSFTVSVFGGDLITVDSSFVRVIKSAYEDGGAPATPTQTIYEQIIAKIEQLEEEVAPDAIDEIVDEYLQTLSIVQAADFDGITIYKGDDGKYHAQVGSGGCSIDDDNVSTETTYSSSKIESYKSEFVLLDDFDDLEDVVADNTTNIAENDKRIEQLFKLTKGQIWDFENKVESGTNAKVSGAMYESILDVRGNATQDGTPTPTTPIDVVGVTELNITVGAQTRKITPPFTLYKVGNYIDTMDIENGVWIKRNGSMIANTVRAVDNSGGTYRTQIGVTDAPNQNVRLAVYSNKFSFSAIGNPLYGCFLYAKKIFLILDQTITSKAMAETWIEQEKPILIYPLAEETTSDVNSDDLAWIKALDGTDADKTITITDQNGNDVSYLVEYLVKLSEVVTNE